MRKKDCDHIVGYDEYESGDEKFAQLFANSSGKEPEMLFSHCPHCGVAFDWA
jgi:hypothetical protein